MMEGGVLDQWEDTSGIGSAKEQGDAEGEAVEDFLKTKIGRGLTREDIRSIYNWILQRMKGFFVELENESLTNILSHSKILNHVK